MIEIETAEQLLEHLQAHGGLDGVVVQGLDLQAQSEILLQASLQGAVFLGCRLQRPVVDRALTSGALIFPEIPAIPFSPYRPRLYSVEELYDCFDRRRPESYRDCLDARIYAHWQRTGRAAPGSILETLARRLHDHAISDALEELLIRPDGSAREVVAIMGGHALERGDPRYTELAGIARALSRAGFLMASGGGPGAMEATHVGVWFASRPDGELDGAMRLLAQAPRYDHPGWLAQAFEVRAQFPVPPGELRPSVGIPTWHYGHEPPNAFPSHIAKYFANSVREDGLLMIAKHGVIFAPGSAGTIQEIFQDACQNHYLTPGMASPMVFYGVEHWTRVQPAYPLLQRLAQGHEYERYLTITDSPAEIVRAITAFAAHQAGRSSAPAPS